MLPVGALAAVGKTAVLARVVRHEVKKLKGFLKKYDKILEILKKIHLDDYLDEEEKENILYDIGCIKTCIEKYVEKE